MKRWNIAAKSKTSEFEYGRVTDTQRTKCDNELWSGEKIDEYLIGQSKKFMKYRLNVFLLQRVSAFSVKSVKFRLHLEFSIGSSRLAALDVRSCVQ